MVRSLSLPVQFPSKTDTQFPCSRLINYTPHATLVRLASINAVNAYLTLTVLSLTGGFQDPRLLLPGWVSIATVRTSLVSLYLESVRGFQRLHG